MTMLPQFPSPLSPALNRVFAPLCEALPPDEAARLKPAMAAHIVEIHHTLRPDEFVDLSQALRMAAILGELLDGYASYTEPQRRLLVGAARYFVQSQDVEADTASVMGFDDDMEVLNYVLLAIGRADLSTELL